VTQGAHGTVAVSGNNVIYTAGAGYSGTDTFTYNVVNACGSQASATVTVTVTGSTQPPTAVIGQIRAGKLRALAVTGPQRWPGLPDVPTVAEQGVAGYDVRSWAGLLVPAGTPRAVVDRLNAENHKALQEPALRQKLVDIGGEARGTTPDEMKAMLVAENDKWTRLVAEANIPRE
jgi:tripartite-type tricarboxylate transporter receptor subunit TctC